MNYLMWFDILNRVLRLFNSLFSHFSEERKYYECPICKIEFDQIVALKDHVHIHCENGVYNCPNCHKVSYFAELSICLNSIEFSLTVFGINFV